MIQNWNEPIEKKVQYAGLCEDVIEAPSLERSNIVIKLLFTIKSLFTGLKVTLYYFLRPNKIVTQQYPENRLTLKMPERFRHNLRLKYDMDGLHNCTGCKICEANCPNTSIIINSTKGEISKKLEVDNYIWRQDSCTFCNICVLVCPFDALEWTSDFESSVYDRRLLVTQLNQYAGPPAKVIEKMDDDKRSLQLEDVKNKKREKYKNAPVPLNGTIMAGVSKLGDKMEQKGGGQGHV